MYVERVVKEIVCDACCATISVVKNTSSNQVNNFQSQKLKHFCEGCSKRIVNLQIYNDHTIDEAIAKTIEEGQYKKSLNDQGIMLC